MRTNAFALLGLALLLNACSGAVCLPNQECSTSIRPAGSNIQQAAPVSPQPSVGEKAVTSTPAPQVSESPKARSRADSIMGKLSGPGVVINVDAPMPKETRKASGLTSGLIVNDDVSLVRADPRPTKVKPKPSTPQAAVPPPPAPRPAATKPPADVGGKPPAAGKPSGRTSGSGQTLSSSPPAALAAQGELVPTPAATGAPTPLQPLSR